MRRDSLALSVMGVVLLLLALIMAVSVAFASNGGAPRVTTLSGAEEVPSADPDGSGFASVRLNVGQERVCWEISYENISEPFAAHIHKAPAGSNGGVVVPLFIPSISSGCVSADAALIQDIIDYPDQYYINVHNADYPGGAIRGQLSNPGQSN
jgi:CHRD domain